MTSNDTADHKPIVKDESLNNVSKNKADGEKKEMQSVFKKPNVDGSEKIDCISKVIGSYGPWQKKFVFFYMIIYLISPFQNYGIVFYAAKSDFWCADESFQNLTTDERLLLKNTCIKGCKNYEFDRSLYHTTIINEWNLICDDAWLVSTAASVYQLGYAFSSIIVGYISDRYGRSPAFKGVLFLEILAGFGQSFAPSIHFFLISRFLLGIAAYGRFSTGLLLIMEIVGPKKRSILSILVENSWFVGYYIMIAFFYFVSNFRYVQATVTTIEIIALFYLHLVPESIRWNIVNGRYDEAKKTLRIAATMKYKDIDSEILETRIDKLITHYETELNKEKNKKKVTILQLWSVPKMLGICCILYTCFFTNHLISYSIIFNSNNLTSNIYLNLTAITTAAFFANTMLYFIIERLNRRTLSRIAYSFMIISCFCLAVSFYMEDQEKASLSNKFVENNDTLIDIRGLSSEETRKANQHTKLLNNIFDKYDFDLRNISRADIEAAKPKEKNYFRLLIGVILKYSTKTCYHTIYVLSVESFPTIIRQLSMGTCSLASRFASVSAPFTKELSNVAGLPFTYGLFTTLAICSFTAIFFIPETRGKEIPDTIADCLKIKEEDDNKEKLTGDVEETTPV